ncbi:MAG: twin-arginine translocase subunit TatC [Candidatus Brocadiia bacterium]|nr:MAG: twin-arginine translocase subunit TatC [Candidatus Brocadiia bacterium]
MGKKGKTKDPLDTTMSLGDHLEELRLRLILTLAGLFIGTCISFYFGADIIALIKAPYDKIRPDFPLTTLAPADAFVGYMKISFISGLILSSPWVIYQIWMFISAGLFVEEKKYVYISMPFSVILFIAGALFFLFAVAPFSLVFFLKFGDYIGVSSNWTLSDYVTFMTTLMLVFWIAFQTPIAIFILNKVGLVSLDALRKSRKFVILVIFVIAAIATPPDVISQVTLAIPLWMLFELGIIISSLWGRKKASEGNS